MRNVDIYVQLTIRVKQAIFQKTCNEEVEYLYHKFYFGFYYIFINNNLHFPLIHDLVVMMDFPYYLVILYLNIIYMFIYKFKYNDSQHIINNIIQSYLNI